MSSSIKRDLVRRMKQVGAFDVKVADPRQGFDKIPPEAKPISIWPECKSVVVFAVATSPACNNIYLGTRVPWQNSRNLNYLNYLNFVPNDIQSDEFAMERLSFLFVTSIKHKSMMFLTNKGYTVSFKYPPLKMSAFESGIGIYGRSGLILHPVLGNRMTLGAILTDAYMEPDPKLENYAPCVNCELCMKKCPAKAFDPEKEYPESFSFERCTKKRTEIVAKGYYCHNCFAVCPAGKFNDNELLNIRHAENLSKKQRFDLYNIDLYHKIENNIATDADQQ